MRLLPAFALAFAASGCGQTGSLYLPDESVETPVEIRGPGEAAAPAAPAPAEQKPAGEDEEKAPAVPPGR